MMENKNTAKTVLGILICFALALVIALGAGILFGDKAQKGTDTELRAAINAAAEGNAGYKDITDAYIPAEENGVFLYLVKSGTGGKDLYCVLATAKSRGCTVDTLTAFSSDGVITYVGVLKAEGGNGNGMDIIEKSGILSKFNGVRYDSETVTIKGNAAGGFDDAVVAAVNKACAGIKNVLYVEEESK